MKRGKSFDNNKNKFAKNTSAETDTCEVNEESLQVIHEQISNSVKESWQSVIRKFVDSSRGKILFSRLINEYNQKTVYPSIENLFQAFTFCELKDVRVVILGQDPYHNVGQATGLAFSVPVNCKLPPSLVRILKEAGVSNPHCGSLESWAKQGVLLLNVILSVEAHKPASHSRWGWEQLTDLIISYISEQSSTKVIFMLWGNKARSKKKLINIEKHYILESSHPSPLASKGDFVGSKCFEKANELLESQKLPNIMWTQLN